MWVRRVRRALEKQETPYVIFQSWNKDIVLLPTILVCFVFALVQALGPEVKNDQIPALYTTLGGAWFTIFLLNWIILRFDMKLMWVVILVLGVVVLVLALQMLGFLGGVLASIRSWDFYLNSGVYLGLGIIFSLGIVISWLHQQFNFALVTANETEIHSGIFGKVEKISREQTLFEKNVSEDALEKGLFRMGTIIIRAEVPHSPRTYVFENVLFIDTKELRARDIQSEERVTIATKATADER